MKLNKKANIFANLTGLGIGLAGMVIIFAVMFLIISNTQTQIIDQEGLDQNQLDDDNLTSVAWNSTQQLAVAADGIPGWLPLIVITVIGGLLIGLVAKFGKGM